MGAAAYNRGSAVCARAFDAARAAASARETRRAERDELARAREQIASLERDLRRARRCIAELRRSKEARLAEAKADMSRADAVIHTLTRIAFPGDTKEA